MKKFTVTKEISIDDIPGDMYRALVHEILDESCIGFSSDGKGIYLSNGAYIDQPQHDIIELVKDLGDDPDAAKSLIPTLELAIAELKKIVSDWE